MADRFGRVAGGRWPVKPKAASCFVRRSRKGPTTFPGCQKVGGPFRYGRWWFPELRFSLLFSTTPPSTTGEKFVLYKLFRAVVS